jgi:xanthine dehydrogenase accessory factor
MDFRRNPPQAFVRPQAMMPSCPSQSGPDLPSTVVAWCDRGAPFAVVQVLSAQGSTPRPAGTGAVVQANGTIYGTIGGGAVEAEAQRRAVEAIRSCTPVVFDFTLRGEEVAGLEPVCGGVMRVLINPAAAKHRQAYAAAAALSNARQRGWLLTRLQGTDGLQVVVQCLPAQGLASGLPWLGQEILAAILREGKARFVAQESAGGQSPEGGLVEPRIPSPLLVIVGGGHVGQAVALQARFVGFDALVVDDRPEFTAPELFPPGTNTRCGPMVETLAGVGFGQDTYVVIVTRGHAHDAAALELCLRRPTAYLGMIGSRRKVTLLREHFLASGKATAVEFARVHAPIGLEIGAVTVPEIAVSIVAELVAVRRQ